MQSPRGTVTLNKSKQFVMLFKLAQLVKLDLALIEGKLDCFRKIRLPEIPSNFPEWAIYCTETFDGVRHRGWQVPRETVGAMLIW